MSVSNALSINPTIFKRTKKKKQWDGHVLIEKLTDNSDEDSGVPSSLSWKEAKKGTLVM